MKPRSPHWADTTAVRIIKSRNKEDPAETIVVASGITPSGRVHVGNFREVITVDLVARALKDAGRKVRFIYSWDNFDTFRKVPKNVPKPDDFTEFLRRPIARIPDPWGDKDNYAAGRIALFEAELEKVGIDPEFIYQHDQYSSGTYAKSIKHALEHRSKIIEVLNAHRSSPLAEDWLPTSIYCEKCERDEMEYQRYLPEWDYEYKCASCGHEAKVDIRKTKNLKLSWRIDWPMRWAFEKVDFEPGGKDHSSQGGSYDTGKDIAKSVWDIEAPLYLQYDFVMIKGGTGKMSSSSGDLITVDEVTDIYEPQILRWIFASQRPNTDFAIAFDEDVIKTHDEFDRAEATAFEPQPAKPGKWPVIRRAYELSIPSGAIPEKKPFRPGFRVLCNRLQICDGDIQRTLEKYYTDNVVTAADREAFDVRSKCALNWLKQYASEDFRYEIHREPIDVELSEQQVKAIIALKSFISSHDIDALESKQINDLLYSEVIHKTESEPKEVFQAAYQKIIGKDRGPRLPSFLKEVGKERLLRLL